MASKKNEAKIKFSAETAEFDSAIKKSTKEMSMLKGELKLNEAEMKNNGVSAEGLRRKNELLAKQQEQQKIKTQALSQELESAKKIYGEDSQEVARLTNKLNASKASEQRLESQIKQTNDELKNQEVDSKKLAESQANLKKGLDNVANASGAVAGAVVAITAATVKQASEYEDSLAKVDTLADGAMTTFNGRQMSMKDAINELSNETGKGVNDIAEAVYQAMSAGQDASNAVAFVSSNLKLSKGGFTEVAKATDIVTTILNAYSMEAEESARVSDILIQTQNKGKTTVDELAGSMGAVIPTAKASNVELEQVANSYAIMTANGVNTARSTTQLNSLLDELSTSSKASAKALKAETGKSFKELMAEGYSLGDVLEIVQNHSKKTDTEFGEMFKKSNARKAALTLMKDGADGFNKSLEEMKNSTGSTDKAVDKLQTSSTKLNKSINKVKNVGLELGGVFLEELQPAIDDLGDKAESFSKYAVEHIDEIANGIKTVGAVAGTAFAVNKTAKFINSLSTIKGATTTAVAGIRSLVTARAADTAATTAETVAQTGLNSAMKANILGLAVTSAVALGVAMYNASKETAKVSDSAKKARDEIKDFKQSLDDSTASIDTQFASDEKLLADLDKIFDKNGKVKKGYENRAKVIQNELKESYDIELEMNNGTVKSLDKVKKKIADVITAKKAEALINANADKYNEAIQKQQEYIEKIAKTNKAIAEAEVDYDRKQSKVDEFNRMSPEELKNHQAEYQKALSAATSAKQKVDQLNNDLKTYSSNYATYSSTVYNYEKLQSAIVKGDTKAISEAMNEMSNNLLRAETATKESLEKQKNDTQANFEAIKKAYEDGTPGITQESVKQAKAIAKAANNELKKWNKEYGKNGKEGGESYASGIGSADGKRGGKKLGTKVQSGLLSEIKPDEIWKKIKNSSSGVSLTFSGKLSQGKLKAGLDVKHNAEGSIVTKPILTTFAEDGPEAAIPINNKPRSRALWIKTGQMMGMFNANRNEIGNAGISAAVDMAETNALLRAIASKSDKIYIGARQVSEETSVYSDRINGTRTILAERGCAYE